MANPTEHLSESPPPSVVLPLLRSSRHGSLTSLSTASRLDKDIRSQTLDQIHHSACNTDTLTTFNEYTSPPSASSSNDGKGIASELHGGLSGLYNRFRASVGNVRDIVSHITVDGDPDDRSLRDPQLPISSSAHSNRQLADLVEASTPSTDSLNLSQGSLAGHSFLAGNLGLDSANNEKNPKNKSTRISPSISSDPLQGSLLSKSSPSAAPVPLTQTGTRATALPTVSEINPKLTQERDSGKESLSNPPATSSITPLKPLFALPAESLVSANADTPNSQTPMSS